MHMQFFDEVQALLNDDFMDGINSDEEEDIEWDHVKNMDIWDDQQTMVVLNRGQILVECNLQENTRIKRAHFIITRIMTNSCSKTYVYQQLMSTNN